MRWILGSITLASVALGGCIAQQPSLTGTITTGDAAALCRGQPGGIAQARCRGAFARDAARAEAAETIRLRYAMEQVGSGLARGDDPGRRVQCTETAIEGRLETLCFAKPHP